MIKGVRGWLLALCLALTLFGPLFVIGAQAVRLSGLRQFFGLIPALRSLAIIEAILSAALALFSVYAGVGLWRIRPGAVRTAKAFLFFFVGHQLVRPVVPYAVFFADGIVGDVVGELARSLALGLIVLAVVFVYLIKSKRVAATYTS